jgi:peptide-methionine (S)-S-oxide reductase
MNPVQQIARCGRIVCATSALVLGVAAMHSALADSTARLPAPALDAPRSAGPLQTAVLAGGCFWGVQGVFQHVRGVRSVLSGYAGGAEDTAHYHLVSSGTTGHAESVEIRFDPQAISYGEILRIFFSVVHDPTEFNRQGPDVGPQYRSEIFYRDDTQASVARAYIAQLDKARVFKRPIATRVDPLKGFYRAEETHQDFLIRYPDSPYIVINDLPKIEALKAMFADDYRDQPVRATDSAIPITISSGSERP